MTNIIGFPKNLPKISMAMMAILILETPEIGLIYGLVVNIIKLVVNGVGAQGKSLVKMVLMELEMPIQD
tara:strand:+ start:10006 stop:10212 length:207 start_codon:yes stop_codon:yes gene_type:complete